MPRAIVILVTSLTCLLAGVGSSPALAQQEVRLDGALWSFTIPKGWERIPEDFIKSQNEVVASRSPMKMAPYAMGIWRVDNPLVYALFQPIPDPRMNSHSFEDIERIFSAAPMQSVQDTFKSSFTDIIASSSFDTPQLDRDRKRIIMTVTITNPQGQQIKGLTQGLLWAGGMVNVHAYAPAGDFDKKLPELATLADAVHFDPGQTFEPGTLSRFNMSPGVQGGLIGGAAAGAYGVYYQRRQKRRRAESSAAPTV